jgi:hypothetical protein
VQAIARLLEEENVVTDSAIRTVVSRDMAESDSSFDRQYPNRAGLPPGLTQLDNQEWNEQKVVSFVG